MQRYFVSDKIVHFVSEPWCEIVSNVHQLLIKEGLSNGGGVLGVIHSQSRLMIRYRIFGTLLILNLYVKLKQ